MIRRKDSMS
jgi:8-oxo-dGTP pyrophosphatase MutT (NUDIX family)